MCGAAEVLLSIEGATPLPPLPSWERGCTPVLGELSEGRRQLAQLDWGGRWDPRADGAPLSDCLLSASSSIPAPPLAPAAAGSTEARGQPYVSGAHWLLWGAGSAVWDWFSVKAAFCSQAPRLFIMRNYARPNAPALPSFPCCCSLAVAAPLMLSGGRTEGLSDRCASRPAQIPPRGARTAGPAWLCLGASPRLARLPAC